MNDTIKTVLDVFRQKELNEYPRQAIDLALEHEAEITPYLLRILEDLLTDPEDRVDDQWSYGPMFALQLLGHFKNCGAHAPIVNVMSLPDEVLDPIFGDMITEDFPRILYQTCGGRYDRIKDLVLSRNANEYVRGAAMKALVMGVLFGELPQGEVMDFFSGLFSGSEADDSSNFWSEAASCVCDLYPEELMDLITDAYERELIFPGYIGIESFFDALAEGKESYLQDRKRYYESDFHDDFHLYMSWWAAFEKKRDGFQSGETGFGRGVSEARARKMDKKKKARRKQAKASKKKNRR